MLALTENTATHESQNPYRIKTSALLGRETTWAAWYIYGTMHMEVQPDVPVPRGLLKQNIAERLREEILSGRIAPGAEMVEGRGARQYGTAQFWIGEALNILAAQGFVAKGHGRSARVLKLTDPDI